ncbi:PspC domain-containing protein [uncultured Butyricimonas sp.]|uniref:PspC domain-containing protein n=1 Tax=uncultured Butyricimonas sp. TaxID=1268785 RepID=UPI0026DBA7A3|nr:PspC domain-containing protein [uncultured Butyricimonas sp.]
MKKTYTINLSGKIFHIDDDALDKLQTYINTLKTHYSREEDGNEIMEDIENRIGELFTEYLKGQYREVVTIDDVEQVIATMGAPNDIIDEDEEPQKPATPKQTKKLYRDPDNRVFGGVAGGMAAYWGISPLLLRVCFIIMTFYYGIFFIVYIILWIAVPKAKTSKQKLEMKGEDINVSNIERSIKEEYQEVKHGKGAKYANRVGEGFSDAMLIVGKVLAIIIGIGLFCGGTFFLFCLLSALFLPHWFPWGESYMGITYALSPTSLILGKIGILFLFGIPIIMIIFTAIKLLFSFKSNNKAIAFSALGLWLASLTLLIIVAISEGTTWTPRTNTYEETIQPGKCETLTIQVDKRHIVPKDFYRNRGVLQLHEGNLFSPYFAIRPSHGNTASIVIRYSTHENNPQKENITFDYKYTNDTLRFDNYAQLNSKWRAQNVDITVYLPEGTKIRFTPEAVNHLSKRRHAAYPLYSELNDHKSLFIMQDGEIRPLL